MTTCGCSVCQGTESGSFPVSAARPRRSSSRAVWSTAETPTTAIRDSKFRSSAARASGPSGR